MGMLQQFEDAMPFLYRWLEKNASVPIKYRLTREVEGYSKKNPAVQALIKDLYNYPAALDILDKQAEDGSWGKSFRGTVTSNKLKTESPYEGIEYQFSRLAEMGFDKDHRAIQKSAGLLFKYLEDNPKAPLWEARFYLPGNPGAVKWYLRLMGIISAKLLSMAGYQEDERLREWIISYITRLNEYLESERSKSPYTKYKGKYIVDEEIMTPGYHLLDILAYNKWLKSGLLGNLFLTKLYNYLSDFPDPPKDCPTIRYSTINYEAPDLYVKAGDHIYRGLGIPTPITREQLETKYRDQIPAVLKQLEMRARIGFLDREDPVLLWLLSHQDERGIIVIPGHLHKMVGRDTYHYFPLHSDISGQGKHVDTTFRTFLIVHYLRRVSKIK